MGASKIVYFSFAVFLSLTQFPLSARAMDAFEIQVYDDAIDKPGEYVIEMHLNTVAQGRQTPEYDGEMAPHGTTHLTFEPSMGITPHWELGMYLQFAANAGTYDFGGIKLRSKMLSPRSENNGFFYGLNFELGRIPKKFEDHEWGTEFRPIFGYGNEIWLFDINPLIGVPLVGDNKTPDFEPCFKITRKTGLGFNAGIEYYSGLGPLNALVPIKNAEQVLYVVGDLENEKFEFNLGIGRGLNSASNDWTVKSILGTNF